MKTSILLWRYGRGHKDFTRANLAESNLRKVRLQFVVLSQANLQAADLSQSHLVGAELIYANLRQAKLVEANLIGANLLAANLQGADLSRCRLCGSLLNAIDLSYANLDYASLTGADLRAANLQGASLRNANLRGASLRAANLEDADLTGADLEGADLTGTELENAYVKGSEWLAPYATSNGAANQVDRVSNSGHEGPILEDDLPTCPGPKTTLQEDDLPTSPGPTTTLQSDIHPDTSGSTRVQAFDRPDVHNGFPHGKSNKQGNGTITNGAHPYANGYARDVTVFQGNDVPLIDNNADNSAESQALEADWSAFFQGDSSDVLHFEDTENVQQDWPIQDCSTIVPIRNTEDSQGNHLSQTFNLKDAEDAQGRLLRSILLRKGHARLRQKLLRAYDDCCAISRCGVVQVLEVAYILPFSGKETNQPSNALLLRSDLHLLFDLHLLTIDPQTLTVSIAPTLMDSHYSDLAGRSLYLPRVEEFQPNLESLAFHQQLCSWQQEEESAWSEAYAL